MNYLDASFQCCCQRFPNRSCGYRITKFTGHPHIIAICSQLEADGDAISGQDVKTVEATIWLVVKFLSQ